MLRHYRSKQFIKILIVKLLFYFVLCDLAFVFMFPFINVMVNAVKSPSDLMNITVKWVPRGIDWQNFVIAITELNYFAFFKNSVLVTGIATIGHIFSCAFIAYGFARYNFPGKGLIFGLVIFTLIVPVQVIIFPLYIQYSDMGWLNTYLPLTVPTFLGFGLRGGLFIFIYRQFFMSLPYELEEAARIDGCGPFSTFVRIVLPISKSSILVSAILSMVWHWNDYFEPNIYNSHISMNMLPSRLPLLYARVLADEVLPDTNLILNEAMIYAATFLVILPILVVFIILQDKFMEGVERSGLTGQ
jgi:multiple sugar transport system permease protein